MESDLQLSFSDFPEEAQLRVLSFVNPEDLKAFACTSKKFSVLCTNDQRLWLLQCTRRWGSLTQITEWGGGKMISYKSLFNLLEKYESIVRFWTYIYEPSELPLSSPPLLLFEWRSFYVIGYRVSPAKDSGYGVIKTPFMWITVTPDGQELCYIDTSNGTLPLTEEDLLREDSEILRSQELVIGEIDAQEYNVILTVSENDDFSEFRRRLSVGDGSEEYESVYRSPPDALLEQISEALAETVIVDPDPDDYAIPSKKLNSRQRRRRRQREQKMSERQWDASYYMKLHERYSNYTSRPGAVPDQPLQGLWKGIARDKNLTFYVVTYTIYMDFFSCKMAGSSVISHINDGFVFTASMTPFIKPPFSSKERHFFELRQHVHQHSPQHDQPDPTFSDVLGIFYANMGPNSSTKPTGPEDAGGRIWLYSDGSFGFGSLKDHHIVHLKPMVENDKLLHVLE